MHLAASAQEAVCDADVVVLVTASPVPMIEDAWVGPGTHAISVGACRPTQREMDPALVTRAHLVVDSRAAALAESGDVLQGSRKAASARTISGRSSDTSSQGVRAAPRIRA